MNKFELDYNQVKWYYVLGHYDLTWSGYAWHNGRLHYVETFDTTDYDTMTDTCPCCKDGGSDDYKDCHCEAYPDVYCELTPLGFIGTIKAIGRKYFWDWFHHPYLMWKFRRRTNNRGNV